jgi:uroporphyrinogen decarboxylase
LGQNRYRLNRESLTPRERVHRALRFQQPDRTPRDFSAGPAVWQRLEDHFGVTDRGVVLQRLGVDCRVVSYDSFCRHPDVEAKQVDMGASLERSSIGGMWRVWEADGTNRDIWGAHRQRIVDDFGQHEHFASYPLASAETLDDLRRYRWPAPDWWHFDTLRPAIDSLNESVACHVRYRVGSVFETAWSLYGFERFQIDLATRPEMPLYVMESIAEVHLENLRRVLELAGDLIDLVYFYDDVATGDGLLIGPKMYERFVQPFHQRLIDQAGQFNKPTMLHCCGSVYPLIPRWIDMGLAVLNPLQPRARNMEPERLAAEFGGRIAFHGGVDIQELLPKASPAEVRERVEYLSELLGRQGGYIIAGSHHLQADTPLENILAMYDVH